MMGWAGRRARRRRGDGGGLPRMGAPTQPSRRPARGRRYLRLPELGDLLLLAWAGLKVNGRRLSPTGQCWPARSSPRTQPPVALPLPLWGDGAGHRRSRAGARALRVTSDDERGDRAPPPVQADKPPACASVSRRC